MGFLLSVICLSTVFTDCLLAGDVGNQLQSLHREIGNNLIKIKKENPQSQPLVYSVLDQLGKYHSFSKSVITKKNKYKSLFKSERGTSESLRKKVAHMETKLDKMKGVIIDASDKLKDTLAREKEDFSREKERFEGEKQLLVVKIEELTRERDSLIQEKDSVEKVVEAPEKPIINRRLKAIAAA